jgi:hypothetical protein
MPLLSKISFPALLKVLERVITAYTTTPIEKMVAIIEIINPAIAAPRRSRFLPNPKMERMIAAIPRMIPIIGTNHPKGKAAIPRIRPRTPKTQDFFGASPLIL